MSYVLLAQNVCMWCKWCGLWNQEVEREGGEVPRKQRRTLRHRWHESGKRLEVRGRRGSGRWIEEVREPTELMVNFRMEANTFPANLFYLKNNENKVWWYREMSLSKQKSLDQNKPWKPFCEVHTQILTDVDVSPSWVDLWGILT